MRLFVGACVAFVVGLFCLFMDVDITAIRARATAHTECKVAVSKEAVMNVSRHEGKGDHVDVATISMDNPDHNPSANPEGNDADIATISMDSPNDNDVSSKTKKDPCRVLFNVGPGTTATRFIHNVLCKTRISTIHWGYPPSCWRKTASSSARYEADELIMANVKAFMQAFDHLKGQDVVAWRDQFRGRFRQALLLGAFSGVQDSPYPQLAETVRQVVLDVTGVEPVYILSEREPVAWSISRIRNHPTLLCRENYDENDLDGCIDRAVAKCGSPCITGKKKIPLKDVFLSLPKLIDEPANSTLWKSDDGVITARDGSQHFVREVLKGLQEGFGRHLERYRAKSVLTLNVFDPDTTVTEESLKKMLERDVVPLLGPPDCTPATTKSFD